jgi:Anti-sigma-K factor rskA
MGRLDTLPADQRAVLGLLLRQGKSYDELSGLLRLDAAAVRERAHAALTALAPQSANGLEPERRAEVADYLLGQGSEVEREAARVYLAGSAPGRAWARGVAEALEPVAPERGLPEIPADPQPAADAPETAPAPPPPAPESPRVSRKGGAILLGALAVLAAAAVALILLLGGSGGGDSSTGASTTPTQASTTASGAATKVRAQANLTAPAGASAAKALGVIQVVEVNGQQQLIAIVQGLPKPGGGEGFGIWLSAPNGRRAWLGFFQSTDKQGRLLAQGALRQPIAGYDQMLVTRQSGTAPKQPGRVYLRGRIQRPQAPSGG